MLTNITHHEGITAVDELLFNTPFGYMFPHTQDSPECYLRVGNRTLKGLRQLGHAMADPGENGDPDPVFDSDTPAIYTYFGQFIDHDITARTDRDNSVSVIVPDGDSPIKPLSHKAVLKNIMNGRRPQLDLDSLYGDGPGLIDGVTTEASALYKDDYSLGLNTGPGYIDLVRDNSRARIADMRNDENVMVSQLHAALIAFHNKIRDGLAGSDAQRYARARQLMRWAYQYVVLNDYLPRVCDPGVVADVVANGPRFFSPAASGAELFMPLEFSVAGFRFGHSMIRPFYKLNAGIDEIRIDKLLEAGSKDSQESGQLKSDRVVDWNFLAADGSSVQMARKIDAKIAQGLFSLPFGHCDPILANLARRNLFRGYLLNIPTGQACATAMGIKPLSAAELIEQEPKSIKAALSKGRMTDRTPLWYYILKEGSLHSGGQTLGAVGSYIVAETLVGLVKQDTNSYLNNCCDPAVKNNCIEVAPGASGKISDLTDILKFAGVHPLPGSKKNSRKKPARKKTARKSR